MATVYFYEKPGCINNTRQKGLLEAAGHTVLAYNLLTEPWTPERLQQFFGQRPVPEWFNQSAPPIKSGAIVPAHLGSDTALQLMVHNPLLIRRPLMQVAARCEVGFEIAVVDRWIGLNPPSDQSPNVRETLSHQNLQTCPRTHNQSLNR